MTRSQKELHIIEGSRVKRYILGKDSRPIVVCRNRLYRCDDTFCIPTKDGSRSIVPYRLDSTQPMGSGEYLDPDTTMAMLDLARGQHGKGTTRLADINPNTILYGIVALVVVYALLTGGIF